MADTVGAVTTGARCLKRIGYALLLTILSVQIAGASPTGSALAGLEAFDAEMAALIERWKMPGASLAVAVHGRIVLTRGYGLADREKQEPVQPATRFRLGSLAKPLTAVAVLRLVEQGQLDLDAPLLPVLGELGPRPAAITDPRVYRITIRQLLQHTAGFDRGIAGDLVFMPRAGEAAARQNAAMPPSCAVVLRDSLERRLDFDPGSRHAYSNIGYCILGRVIERVSGQTYEAFVRQHILTPAGAGGLQLARTFDMAEGEAAYYDYPGAPLVEAMPGVGSSRMVAAPYGLYAMETMDSFGGWIGSSLDYLRFMLAIDGQRGAPLLRPPSLKAMLAPPAGLDVKPSFYGLGMQVRPVSGGLNWWHSGSHAGTKTLAVRTAKGYAWVAAFNSRPKDRNGFATDLDQSLWRAANAVQIWPEGDLYSGQ
ncbi:MAG: beta-lactamase family protein [Ferrovibrio sp.]|uniref:serine hydrolase domain-containing protein n=1 Tax=Ferrovibrio sp. TaxID=1917215 RepID=UPI0026224C6C|nr:serine hydrolase domain-containing protein [Ferrovibrio sp.]MCW0233316.1 beta-lactamase family protein [Ferrovibrio sp.]